MMSRSSSYSPDAYHERMANPRLTCVTMKAKHKGSTEVIELEGLCFLAAASTEAPMSASTSRRLRRADSAGAPPLVFELPMTRDNAIQGAVEGIRRAWAAGEHSISTETLAYVAACPKIRHVADM